VSDIHIARTHTLGLKRARKVARQWMDQVEREYGMAYHYTEGPKADVARFARPGAEGTLHVTADTFTLHMQLGFMLEAFGPQIQAKVSGKLDKLLGAA